MNARVVPRRGYLRGGERASVTYVVGDFNLFPDMWGGFSLEFRGSRATSLAEVTRVDVRTFQFVIPDHGVAETVTVTLTCSNHQFNQCCIPSFEYEFVDGFAKIADFLPVNKTPLAVPLVVALGIRDDTTDYGAMDRAFVHFYNEDIPPSLLFRSVINDLHALTEDENLLHICSDLGLSQFLAYICHNHSDASDALKATWKGRTPLDVARYRACMPADSGCHDGHIEARSLLEPMQEQMLYGTTRHQSPLPHPTPQLQYGLLHSPPAVPRKPPEHDRLPVARHRLASSATQQSADSGVGVCSIASALSEIGLKEQKERAIGTVRVTRSYHSNVEEGMLQLKVGQTVYILSHADDGKWYGIAGDQIGFFYITSVDHDNITWQENWQQSVEVQRAEVIRDSTPDRDDIGFLQVKVHDEVYVLAMPDSGLWTAEKDSCVGYIYSSDLQLLGEESKGWDHAPAEEHWSRRMRTTSIYTQPHHVKFYGRAVKSNSLTGPNALHFKANDRIGIIDSPSTTSSGLWFGKLGRKAGKFLFSDVEVESYAGLEEIREVSSHKSTTLSHSVRLPVHQKVIDEMKSQTLPQRRTHDISHTSSTPILPPRGAARIQGFGQHHFSKPTRGSQVPSLPENVNRRFDNL